MTTPPVPPSIANNGTSTRPYLIRALHDWCTDNGFTPYVAVFVGPHVKVPQEYVKNNEIVLNIGFEATTALKLGNEAIEFKARFGGTSRDIYVPVDHVIAIYARENGQGMAFPAPESSQVPVSGEGMSNAAPASAGLKLAPTAAETDAEPHDLPEGEVPTPPDGPAPSGRPTLKRIK
jgi:stringent starvation protein B